MNAEDVAHYLSEHPGFFEQYAELLARITIPHPHGGRAISLADRQLLALRDKNRALESKLAELIRFGEENDAIGGKVHRLSVALLAARSLEALLEALYFNLREDFAVPHAALRIWGGAAAAGAGVANEFASVSDALKDWCAGLAQPYCGPAGNPEPLAWFGEGAGHVRSVALMPLAQHPETVGGSPGCFGMLALGSADVLRFYPEMGTLYLRRIGDLVGASLARRL